jgi:cytochrome c peroxidase
MNKVVMHIYAMLLLGSLVGPSTILAQSSSAGVDETRLSKRHEPIRPLPVNQNEPADEVALGNLLFHDTRLSADNTISCSSCHDLKRQGIDHLPRAIGIGGNRGPIKTPTVYNSSLNFVQFWDGRAASLEAQAAGPVHNPIEMGSNWKQVISKLKQDPKMVRRFNEVYADGMTPTNITKAISTFERTLITINSPFDRWLRGDEHALSEKELQGYQLFKSYGCIACHQGANVGGNLFAKMGAMNDYFAGRGTKLRKVDMGRFNVTGKEEDRYMFKVPSLRLVSDYSYFFHDASASKLEDAIRIMGKYQLGREIPKKDIALIAGFLRTLKGEAPGSGHE